MNNDKMAIVSISLTGEDKKAFDALCQEENRGATNLVKHMLRFYVKHKDRVK